jgi:hypothetical protein
MSKITGSAVVYLCLSLLGSRSTFLLRGISVLSNKDHWHRFVKLCRLLRKSGMAYTVEYFLDEQPPRARLRRSKT